MSRPNRSRKSFVMLLAAVTVSGSAMAGHYKRSHSSRGASHEARCCDESLVPSNYTPDAAQAGEPDMGTRVRLQSDYRMMHDTTYLAARAPLEQMGASVDWSDSANEATIGYKGRTLVCTPGSREVVVIENGVRRTETWQQEPMIHAGLLYLPMRPAFTGLGLGVHYQGGAATIGAGFYLRTGRDYPMHARQHRMVMHRAEPGFLQRSSHDYQPEMGERVQIRSHYRVLNDTAYVPMRAPFEQLGATVTWNETDKLARIEYKERTILCSPGSHDVVVIENGVRRTEVWEAEPTYYNGELYLPMRPAFTGLGLGVNYQGGAITIGGGFFFGL